MICLRLHFHFIQTLQYKQRIEFEIMRLAYEALIEHYLKLESFCERMPSDKYLYARFKDNGLAELFPMGNGDVLCYLLFLAAVAKTGFLS